METSEIPHGPSSRRSRALRSIVAASLVTGAALLQPVADPAMAATDSDLCFIVADRGGSNGGDDRLVTFNRVTEAYAAVGPGTGTYNIEAADFWPGNDTLYAIDANRLGSVDLATGEFTAIGGSFGSATGSAGTQTISDADGMAFDPLGGFIWASERNRGADYIFQIDPTDGTIIRDAFGAGADYVVSTPYAPSSPDLDDIAVSPIDGKLYAVANSGSSVPSQLLVEIDRATGDQTLVGPLGEADMEGLSFNPFGSFYGTDGTNNELFDISLTTGAATNGRPIPIGADYESVSCLTGTTSTIDGTVYLDADASGTQNGGDIVQPDAIVELIRDLDGDGVIDPNEVVVAEATTDASGNYDFELAALGDFILRINNPSLPDGAVNTTPTTIPVTIAALGDTSTPNDFGFFSPPPPPPPPPLSIDKSNDPAGIVAGGDTVTYTIVVTNNSDVPQTGVDVTDIIPPGVTYVPDSTRVILPGDGATRNLRDEFAIAEVYTGDDGNLPWAGPWVETGDNNDAKDGDVFVKASNCPAAGTGDSCLTFDGPGAVSVARAADLSTALSPTLTYHVFAKDELKDGSTLKVEVTGDGTTWTTLATYTASNPGKDNERSESFPLPLSALTAGFQIRVIHDGVGEVRNHTIDDIDISWTDPSAPAIRDVLDEFTVKEVYTGNDGTVSWGTDWVEAGDNNDAKDGDIAVRDDGACNGIVGGSQQPCLRYDAKDAANSLTRTVDLSAAPSPVTLSFGWINEGEFKDGQLVVEVSGDGTTFSPLVTFDDSNAPKDGPAGAESFTLDPGVLTANFALRLRSELVGGALEFDNFLIDDVKIDWTEPSGGDGGPPPALLGAVPPPTLLPGQSMIVTFDVTIDAAESFPTMQNEAQATSVEQPIPVSDSVANSLAPRSSELALTKTIDPVAPSIGDAITYVVTLTNNGPDTATGVKINETPPSVLAATFLPAEGTEYDVNNNQWSVPRLDNGESTTLTIIGTADASGDYTNTAAITASESADPNLANNEATVVAAVPPTADLSLDKELVGGPAFFVGDPVEFNVVVTNDGPDAATNVTIEDAIPAGAGGAPTVTPTLGTYTGTTWTIPSIASGASATLNVVGLATGNGDFTNSAEITASDQVDPDSTVNNDEPAEDDQDSVDFQVVPLEADLAVTKIADKTTVEVGEVINFTISVTNNGPDPATNIEIAEALPAEFSDDSIVVESLGVYAISIDTWFIDTLAVGQTATLDIAAEPIAVGNPTNTASVQALDQNDPDPLNDSESVPLTLNPIVDDDKDGIPDRLDIDDDNDGIVDVVEIGPDPLNPLDTDGDLIPDYLDIDADNDGVPDNVEAQGTGPYIAPSGLDIDDDGLDDAYDDDTSSTDPGDSVGIVADDFDGDTRPNHLDIDADDDGITDLVESFGTTVPLNGDADLDGLDDAFDTIDNSSGADPVGNPAGGTVPGDLDGTGGANYLDIDADDDGITDLVESHPDGAVVAPSGDDDDNDGLDDAYDDDTLSTDPVASVGTDPENTDSNGAPDYLDIDTDDDGIPDNIESQTTLGYDAPSGLDDDGDGLDNVYDADDGDRDASTSAGTDPENTDTDTTPDYRDDDSDNDGVLDATEGGRGTFENADDDGDGLDNGFDNVVGPDVNDDIVDPAADLPDTDGDVATEDVDYRDVRPSVIGDLVFLDLDGDGVQDAGEDGILGVTVELLDAGGNFLANTTTDSDGLYSFSTAGFDDYRIRVVYPEAMFSPTDAGSDDAVDSDVAANGMTAVFTGAPGPFADVDAGVLPASIGDFVFVDLDDDGVQDAGELGVAGVTVQLRSTGGALLDTETTDAAGRYSFDGLVPGADYVVVVVAPTGASFTARGAGVDGAVDSDVFPSGATAAITPVSGDNFDVADAGIVAPTIGDFVWLDSDGDGVQDPGEPGLIGVTVELLDATGTTVIDTTTTDGSGNYSFVVPDFTQDYVVRVTPPAGGTFTSGPGSVVDADGEVLVSPSPGPNNDVDAGVLPASIGDFVFVDLDDDGVQDAGELGVAGVTVQLRTTGGALLDTETTDANGRYSFDGLAPGSDYVVVVSAPAGASFTGRDVGGDDAVDSDVFPSGATAAITPVSGDNFDVADAGIAAPTIGDFVWLDSDGDGVQDPGEPGLFGLQVQLLDATGTTVIDSTTTDGSGNYSFVVPDYRQDYVVRVTPLPATMFTSGPESVVDADGEVLVSPLPGPNNDVDAGLIPKPTLSGSVFDENGDPIPGVVLTIDDGAAFSTTATTQPDGSYQFTNLDPGTYTVTESQPAGFGDVSTTAGTAGGVDTTENVISAITLAPGDAATGYDFVEGYSSIAGTVYEDLDDDGVQDPGEPGLVGVDVTLSGTDVNGAVGPVTVQTNADGDYVFDDLLAGDYTVTEPTQPAGLLDGIDAPGTVGGTAVNPGDEINSIVLPVGTDAVGYDFGEIRPGSVSGNVSDENGDPIGNVTVTLTGTDDRGAVAPVVVTTDVDGDYSFPNLRPGTYTVTESQPAGFGAGSSSTDDTGATTSANAISDLTLAVGGANVNNDFVDTYGSIAGFVFIDVDADGVYDVGVDVPLAGESVTLTGSDPVGVVGPVTVSTNAAGAWIFEDLLAGTYDVAETQPSGFADGLDSVGSVGGTLGNDVVSGIVLPAGIDAVEYGFGEVPEASIAGTVSDENGDPIENVTVTLTGVDSFGTAIAPVVVTTNVDGDFVFDELAPGSYAVTETQPAGFADVSTSAGSAGGDDSVENVISGVTLGNTTVATGYDFVEGYSSIAGTVYEDLDDDGVQDPGEPGLVGVDVTLSGTDVNGAVGPVTVQTLADGSYVFDDLLSGTYVVTEPTQPAGLLDGTDAPGTAGGTAVNPGDEINSIVLPVGTDAVGYDFGEIRPGSVSGNVSDENGDPIGNVTVTLTGTDDRGAVGPVVVTTDVDGDYSFPNLRPGTYTVTESQPAGFGAGSSSTDDTGATTSANAISDLTLAVGGANVNNDFVDTYGSIAGVVFVDENNDGVRQPSEPVLENVDVTLSGTDPNGAVGPVTVQTLADGSYVFDDLLSGDYTVTEVTPSGYLDGADIVGSAGGTVVNPGDEINSITLAAGTDAVGYDFGEIRPGSVSGNVSDENGDPIGNVTVTLTGTDDRGAIAPVAVTTNVDGDYSFPNLRPGTYTVTESQPAGFGEVSTSAGSAGGDDSVQNVVSGVVLDPGEVASGYDFVDGYSSIAGHVFIDVDDDGVYDVGLDVPLAGETVTLSGTDPNGAVGPLTATTNVSGVWVVEGLLAGTYDVAETQPSAFADGRDSVGSEGGTLGNDVVTGIVLPAGTDAVAYDFGEVPEASIAGTVSDENGDPIENVTVTLTGVDSFGTASAPVVVTTNVDGDFVFDELAPGTYTLTESQPAGFVDVSTSAGSAGGDDSVENVISGITLGNTTVAQNYDFVEGYGSIAGTVYEDLDDDGVQDPGEPGLVGVDVTLTGTDANGAVGPVTIQTQSDGSYVFDDLLSGDYTVTEPTQPAGLLDGTDAPGTVGGTAVNPGDEINSITLAAGTDAVGYDFGEIRPGSISGNVSDENGSPIDAVELTLTGIDDLGATIAPIVVATGSDGDYSFGDLRPGTYTVTQTQPASYGDGSQTSPMGDVSLVNVIASITIVAGESAPDNDFVETLSSIRGTVYLDIGENGVLDADDPRLSGVTVRLDGVNENGAIAQVVAVTDVDGTYRFDDLLAGTYVVTEETPAEFNDGTDAAGSVGGTAVNPGDEINSIPLPGGTDAAGYDFGELGTIITGAVFVDDDRDGSVGEGEDVRLEGIEIALLDPSGNEVATTTTGADGTYLFADLAAGEYTVVQDQPDGYGSTTPNRIDVNVPNVGLTQVDFGEDLGSIGDFVFTDVDGDGVQDADEPGVAGVTVRLVDGDGEAVAVTTSDSDGRYVFGRLSPGTYSVVFSLPDGLALTEGGQGAADRDSDPDWVTGATDTITLRLDSATGLVDRRSDIDAGVVDQVIDLSITVEIDRDTAAVGDRVSYTLTPANNSEVPVVGGAEVVFELPPAVTVVDIDAAGWRVQVVGNTATFTLDQVLLPGDSLPIIRVSAAVVDGNASTTAEVTIGTVDGSVEVTFGNNSDVAAFTVPAPQQPSNLPTTGSDLGSRLVPSAIALVLVGIVLQIGARRRRDDRIGRTARPA